MFVADTQRTQVFDAVLAVFVVVTHDVHTPPVVV
jgi:hypothetical protein